jgi:hypothetical protein
VLGQKMRVPIPQRCIRSFGILGGILGAGEEIVGCSLGLLFGCGD